MNADAFLDDLVEIQNAGHALRFEPECLRVAFLSDATTVDDVLRLRDYFPALDKLTIRCEITA